MAVSMNAGFMRSDYMISDAALPMRMEELEQLEQTAKFSEILGEIGNSTATAEEQPVVTEIKADGESAPMLSKAELKALAKAVVRGEVKLEDIPEELVTDVLLTVIALIMIGVPEDEIPVLEEYSEEVQPVQLDVETAEAFISVVKKHENAEVTPDIAKEIVQQTEQLDIPEEMKQEFVKQVEVVVYTMNEAAAITAAPEITSEFTQFTHETDVQTAELPAEVEAVAAVTEQAVTQNAFTQQNGDSEAQSNAQQSTQQSNVQQVARATQTADPADKVKFDEEFQQLKKVITDYTVKKPEPEQQEQNTQQTAVVESPAKNRLVSKSDELMMLKNAAKPAQTAEADVTAQPAEMPQTMAAQLPVVFTRNDGTEIAVKPEEIIQQVTENIIEQAAENADGDTEYSVTLNPEDLGSITVKLTKTVEGSLSVSIMAENARTQRIIDQNSVAIQQGLRQNGIELESWQTVTESQHENRAEDYNGSSKNPYYNEAENSENVEEEDNSFAELISAM